jgi:hypothetical protein
LPEDLVHFVDRAVAASRATLLRALSRKWPLVRDFVATAGPVSRASFGAQACDPTARSGPSRDGGHA